jgi:hypothetical protein
MAEFSDRQTRFRLARWYFPHFYAHFISYETMSVVSLEVGGPRWGLFFLFIAKWPSVYLIPDDGLDQNQLSCYGSSTRRPVFISRLLMSSSSIPRPLADRYLPPFSNEYGMVV